MAWDFTADSDQQKELATKLNTAADNFDSKVEAMYTQIENMGTYWVGEDYNMYKEGTEGYRNALSDLSDGMRMFSKHFDSVAEGTEQLAGELASIIQNATGSSNYGGGATGSSGGMTPSTEAVTGGDAGEGDGATTPTGSGSGSTGNPSSGNVASNEQNYGNPSGDKSSNGTSGNGSGGATTESGTRESYSSGDTISINGQTYSYYAGYQNPDGSVVHMVADNQGKLYYQDESGNLVNVKSSYMNGNGQYTESDATIDSLGQSVHMTVHGAPFDSSVSLKIGDTRITKSDQLSSTVDVQGSSSLGASHIGTGSAYIDNGNTISSDGSLRQSYNSGVFEGQTVNGSTFIKGTSMSDFSNYLISSDTKDVTIQIPQGAKVQWDPSSAPGNGYDFNTSNGPVYLRWDSSANSGNGAYKLVDEYGNFTSTKEFTLEGFNNNQGHWK